MFFSKPAGLRYVNRGDPSDFDWDETTLVDDDVKHTLDLSAIVPANAQLVHLRLLAGCPTVDKQFKVMKTGITYDYNSAALYIANAYEFVDRGAFVDCVGQQIDYKIQPAEWSSLGIIILGWFV